MLSHVRKICGDRLTAFELLARTCASAVFAHRPEIRDPLPGASWYVLVELADSGTGDALNHLLERALETDLAANAVVAKNDSESKALWSIRHAVPEAQFANVKHDVSVPVSKTPELIELAERAVAATWPQARIFAFGHVGDGNIHFNIGPEALIREREALNRAVYDVVRKLGGSISAEHGVGQLRRGEILRHKDPLELELMRALKRSLDPRGLMNPGKVL